MQPSVILRAALSPSARTALRALSAVSVAPTTHTQAGQQRRTIVQSFNRPQTEARKQEAPKRPMSLRGRPLSNPGKLTEAHPEVKSRELRVEWSQTQHTLYPFVWLRDNCPSNFNKTAKTREFLIKDLDMEVKPKSVNVGSDQTVHIHWSDDHTSSYPADWLWERSFLSEQHNAHLQKYQCKRTFWDSSMVDQFYHGDFNDAMNIDTEFMKFLVGLDIHGIAFLHGAPKKQGQLKRIAEKIGFAKLTHYGEIFQVQAKMDPTNVAYTSDTLSLHTDLPYYYYKPTIQMLHCIVQHQGDGGDSMLADGIGVAKQLAKKDPEAYTLLAQTLIDWCDVGKDAISFNKRSRLPLIWEDRQGEIIRINFSQAQRDQFFSVPLQVVEPWYRAMKKYHDMLHHPDNCTTFKMNEGDVMAFDNIRVLHGRTALVNATGERHLEGAYFDWDEVRSRIRVIEEEN